MTAEKLTRLLAAAKQAMALVGVNIEVVANGADLPAGITAQDDYDDTVQAAITGDRKTVYFVASRIANPRAAIKLVSHELVGHMSMEQLLGKRWPELRDAIKRLHDAGKWPEVFAEVSRRYERNADGTFRALDDATFAAEAIAVFAERNIQTSILQRAVNAVRAWLRRLGFAMDMSQGELRQMLWEAGQRLEGRAYRPGVVDDVLGAKQEPKRMSMGLGASGDRAAFAKAGADPESIAVLDRLQDAINPNREGVVEWLRNKWETLRPGWLGALTLRMLGEMVGKDLPSVQAYIDTVDKLTTLRKELQEGGVEIADRMLTFQSKNQEAARNLYRLMHEATVGGTDPAETYQPIKFDNYKGLQDVTAENVAKFIKTLRQQAKLVPGEAQRYAAKIKEVKKLLAQERNRLDLHPKLVVQFEAMPAEAKTLYRQVRDAYKSRSQQYEESIMQRIADLTEISQESKAEFMARIRLQFEAARVLVYFPLSRFGDFWVAATNTDGQREFYMAESQSDQQSMVKHLRGAGYTKVSAGKKGQSPRGQTGISSPFMAELMEVLEKGHAPEAVKDNVYQLFLQSLPDLSIRKNFIHRKAIPGYSQDAARAFAQNTFHGAFQLARLKYTHHLQAHVETAQQIADQAADLGSPEANRLADIVNELRKRHDWIMNPTDSKAVSWISSIGFFWYLGLTPAAALVNLLQVPMVSGPVLGAKYGFGKAAKALSTAWSQALRAKTNIDKVLKGEELAAYQQLLTMGAIDNTNAHNLAAIAESDSFSYNPQWHKVMTALSWSFHKAEVLNRQSTAIASYRLGREAGLSHSAAVNQAAQHIYESQFDYSNANRARWMQDNWKKVLLMFRQYALNMTWMWVRTLHQALKGASPAVRTEARRKFAGLVGMTSLFSGVLGLPMMSVMFGVANALAAAFGDDDEPWDAETEFKAFLREMFGDTIGDTILRGAANKATGLDIASRVSNNELWFRDPDQELEGAAYTAYVLEQMAGPAFGILTSMAKGKAMFEEGHTYRGIEAAMPKALKDALKAVRYASDGATNLKGEPLVEDVSLAEALGQGIGFSPAEISKQYDTNNALKNYESHIKKRRQSLMDAMAMAIHAGDTDARTVVLEKIQQFNRTFPQIAITSDTIKRSLTQRARSAAQMEGGILLDRRLKERLRDAVGAQ